MQKIERNQLANLNVAGGCDKSSGTDTCCSNSTPSTDAPVPR